MPIYLFNAAKGAPQLSRALGQLICQGPAHDGDDDDASWSVRRSDWTSSKRIPLCAYSINQIPAEARATTFVIYYFAYFVNRTYKSPTELPPDALRPDKPPQCDQITYKLLRQIEAAGRPESRFKTWHSVTDIHMCIYRTRPRSNRNPAHKPRALSISL